MGERADGRMDYGCTAALEGVGAVQPGEGARYTHLHSLNTGRRRDRILPGKAADHLGPRPYQILSHSVMKLGLGSPRPQLMVVMQSGSKRLMA